MFISFSLRISPGMVRLPVAPSETSKAPLTNVLPPPPPPATVAQLNVEPSVVRYFPLLPVCVGNVVPPDPVHAVV